eukprot:3191505-Rhodomonas_salina.1
MPRVAQNPGRSASVLDVGHLTRVILIVILITYPRVPELETELLAACGYLIPGTRVPGSGTKYPSTFRR